MCCSRPQFDWLCREKIADGPLIAKWRKPGYEILCSMLAIQKGNHNFGTTSHCRVPLRLRASQVRDCQQHGSTCQHTHACTWWLTAAAITQQSQGHTNAPGTCPAGV